MPQTESIHSPDGFGRALVRARDYLEPPTRRERVWPVLAAATAFAISSMIFVFAAVTAPSVTLTHLAPSPASLSGDSLGPRLAGAVN